MATAKEIVFSKIDKHLHWPIILFFVFTIGNYSFFRYSILGNNSSVAFLKVISQLRIVFPIWIIWFALKFDFQTTRLILKQNIDIILLALSWWLSSIVNQHPSSYLLYAPWILLSLTAVVIVICYTAYISQSLSVFLTLIINSIWKGNLIIFFLIGISLLLIPPGTGPYHLIFTSNTFWSYPALVLAITSLIKARYISGTKCKIILQYFIVFICLVGIYYSARRTPLIILLITLFISFLPLKITHMLYLWGFMLIGFLMIDTIDLKSFTSQLPDSYMKYRIERMFGLVKGRQETSYLDRQQIWNSYMDSFYAKPILGVGLASNQVITAGTPKKFEGYSAHNTFIGILAETGILGALCFLVVLARSLLLLRLNSNELWLRIYLIFFIPTFLVNWVEYNLIPGQIFFLYSVLIWILPRGLSFLQNHLELPKKTKA